MGSTYSFSSMFFVCPSLECIHSVSILLPMFLKKKRVVINCSVFLFTAPAPRTPPISSNRARTREDHGGLRLLQFANQTRKEETQKLCVFSCWGSYPDGSQKNRRDVTSRGWGSLLIPFCFGQRKQRPFPHRKPWKTSSWFFFTAVRDYGFFGPLKMTLGIFLNLASLLSLGDNVSESHCIFFFPFSFSHSLLWILKNIFRITGSCSKFGCVLGRQSYLLVPFLIEKKKKVYI